MKNITVGIIAHVDAGKTTLSEALLYTAGAIKKAGRVDSGSAFLDNFTLERERGITIFSKQAVINTGKGETITLVDTPGHTDFTSETEMTLGVLDYCILVVSTTEKVKTHTLSLLKKLTDRKIPVFIFLNKTDMETADPDFVLNQIRNITGLEIVDFTRENGDQKKDFYEDIASQNEELLNEYMDSGKLSDESINAAVADGTVIPCYKGSALKLAGTEEFYKGLLKHMVLKPYPAEKSFRVYKVTHDSSGTRLVHVKITGGVYKNRDQVGDEKITGIRVYSGEKYESVSEAAAGMLVAFTGLEKVSPEALHGEEPVMNYCIRSTDGADIHELFSDVKVLSEEDPGLHPEFDEEDREIRIRLFGPVQMEIIKSIMSSRFGRAVEFTGGKVLYRETIGNTVQCAGHFEPLRHYAEVHLRLEPGEPGSGIVISSECSTDVLAVNWQRLVISSLTNGEIKGVLTGAPVTDIKIILTAGKASPKHTEGGDFREAAFRAVRQGLMKAENILLEPYYSFRITVPSEKTGRVMTDIEMMHGIQNPPETEGTNSVITGKAPVTEMNGYQVKLSSFTGGDGTIELWPGGYGECHNSQEVIGEKHYDPESDLKAPPGSVFVSHGAGYYVPWDEADSHMHIQLKEDGTRETSLSEYDLDRIRHEREKTEASEDELKKIFESTYGKSTQKDRRKFKLTRDFNKASGGNTYTDPDHYNRVRKKHRTGSRKIMLVDGYNVIYAWDDLSELAEKDLNGARGKLADILSNFAAYEGTELILVFDAYMVKGNVGEMRDYNNIKIVYTREAQTADQYIAEASIRMSGEEDVTVATSDGLVQLIIFGNGCRYMSSTDLRARVKDAEESIRRQIHGTDM